MEEKRKRAEGVFSSVQISIHEEEKEEEEGSANGTNRQSPVEPLKWISMWIRLLEYTRVSMRT